MAALHRGLLSSVQLRLGPKAANLSGAPLRSQLVVRSHGGRNLQGRHGLIISQSKNEPEPESRLPDPRSASETHTRREKDAVREAQAAAQERFNRQYVTFRGEEAVAKGAVVALAAFVGASLLIDVPLVIRMWLAPAVSGPKLLSAAMPAKLLTKGPLGPLVGLWCILTAWEMVRLLRERVKLQMAFNMLAAAHPEKTAEEMEAYANRRTCSNFTFVLRKEADHISSIRVA